MPIPDPVPGAIIETAWGQAVADELNTGIPNDLAAKINKSGDTMTGPLVVPDATADGEALAYDQASWQLGAGRIEGPGSLAIDSTTPLVITQEDGNGASLDIRRISDDESRVRVLDAAQSAYTEIRFETLTRTINMETGAAIVEVPAISGTSQAAQVTAYDATTGQLAIGGHEIGDTGLRDVSSLLTTGWTADTFNIRRTGNVVEAQISNMDYSSGGSATFATLPTGFRPAANFNALASSVAATSGAAASIRVCTITSSTGTWTASTGVDDFNIYVTFTTDDAWPSSLPGSAA